MAKLSLEMDQIHDSDSGHGSNTGFFYCTTKNCVIQNSDLERDRLGVVNRFSRFPFRKRHATLNEGEAI